MSKRATTVRDTSLVSLRQDPIPIPEGTSVTVYHEANGWGLVDVKINGIVQTGEMNSNDYA